MTEKSKTLQLLDFLEKNGVTSLKELEKLSFYSGVRGRISALVKQGRIERVQIHNENYTGQRRNERLWCSAIKFKSYEFESKQGKHSRRGSPDLQARAEKVRQAWLLKNIEKAKSLLEENGYKVIPLSETD